MLGAVPDWAAGDGDAGAILLQAWLRRAVFPRHRLVMGGTKGWLTSPGGAVAMVSALAGANISLVLEPGCPGKVATVATDLAAAAGTARALRVALGDGDLHGDAVELAGRTLRAAGAVLERLSSEGWGSLLGQAGRGADGERLGRSAVVERADGPTSSEKLLQNLV